MHRNDELPKLWNSDTRSMSIAGGGVVASVAIGLALGLAAPDATWGLILMALWFVTTIILILHDAANWSTQRPKKMWVCILEGFGGPITILALVGKRIYKQLTREL